ncbi:MAG: hypothetical protein ACTTIC_00380 [Helicobacteraceae bacterium]
MKTKKDFLFVIFFILSVFALGMFGILYISIKYVPTNKENIMLNDYHFVDKNYNLLDEKQKSFTQKYAFAFDFKKISNETFEVSKANKQRKEYFHELRLGKNSFSFSVKDLSRGEYIAADLVELLLTRFETNDFDKPLKFKQQDDKTYVTDDFEIEKSGRWKIIAKVSVGKDTGIFEYATFAK